MTGATGHPDWWLDELAYAGAEHLDPAYVAGYDRKAGHDPQADLDTLRRLGLDAESTLVDLGAGTGRLGLAAAVVCRRVVAVDVSAAMLDRLRVEAERAGLGNVEVVRAGFLSYVHQGPPADVVYTRHALHQLPDFWKVVALARLAGILRPGGVLLLRDLVYRFEPAEAGEQFETWLAGRPRPPPTAGPAPNSPPTSVRSTARSVGCWSRCSTGPASRSSRSLRASIRPPTPVTSASSGDRRRFRRPDRRW